MVPRGFGAPSPLWTSRGRRAGDHHAPPVVSRGGAVGQQLALSREVSESSLLAVLKALEIQRTLGTEPVLTALRRFPARPAEYAEFPDELDPRLRAVLEARGMQRL